VSADRSLEIDVAHADGVRVGTHHCDAKRRARQTPALAVVVVVSWALLAAGLSDLLDEQRPTAPLVLAVVAAALAGVGVLLGVAVARDRRVVRHLAAAHQSASSALRAIEAVTDPALSYLDLDELLSALLDRTKEALGADVVAVLLTDPASSTIQVRASSGATELAPVGSEATIEVGPLAVAPAEAHLVVVPDVGAIEVGALPEWQDGVASLMAAPLVVRGTSVGTLEVASRDHLSFDMAARRLLQVVADRVAAIVERARLDELAKRRGLGADHANLHLRLLARGTTALGRALDDYTEALHELADVVVPDFADGFAVHVVDQTGARHEVVRRSTPASFPSCTGAVSAHPSFEGDALVRAVIASRRAHVLMATQRLDDEAIEATVHTPESLGASSDISSMLVVPVVVRGDVVATLTFVTGPSRRGYRPSDLETGRELAERVGVAIERVRSWEVARRARAVAERYTQRLRQLVDVSLVVNAQFSEEEVLDLLVEHARRALAADVVVVRTLGEGSSAHGPSVHPVGIDDGAFSRAVASAMRAVARTADVARGHVAHDDASARRGWIAAPITDAGGVPRRVVAAVGAPGTTYSLEDASVLTVLAQMASGALRNAHLYGEVLENEQRLEAVVDASPLAIVELDLSGEAQWWNRAAAALFGWPDRSVPRRIPVREGGALLLSDLLDSSCNATPIMGVALPITGARGQLLELSVSASPLGTADAVSGVLVVAEDVTDRQRLLEQLRQAERLQAMSRMAGALAHDFNNLLTVILGCGDALMRRIGGDAELGPDVAAIHRAGTRAAALTSQLVRIGGQRPSVDPELVHLDEIIMAMKPILVGALGARSRLRISTTAGDATVRIDPAELEWCLLNLVMNARDAMPDGGTCTISTARGVVTVDRGGEQVVLAVADDGTGMDEETAAHCFEPFFTTKGRARGTGLGLAAVHAMISQAGAHVRVTTSRGKGTTCTITLPVVTGVLGAADAEPTLDGRGSRALGRHSGTLLVVDDEPEMRAMVVRQLESRGYEVLAASNASEAMQLLATREPVDLLVTDVAMPGMNGIDLANAVRLSSPALKVLFVSGHLDADSSAMGSLPGDAAIVTKPFGPDELVRAVRALLGPARAGT